MDTPTPAPTGAAPTIRDIAKAVGIHHSTVSRALRGCTRISAQTRRRVETAAETLGYRTNPMMAVLMQSLRQRSPKSFQAALAMPVCESRKHAWHEHSWIYQVSLGAKQQAEALGYSFEPLWVNEDQLNSRSLQRILEARNVQGLVLPPEHEVELNLQLDWDRYSVVSLHLGESKSVPQFDQLVSNHFHSVITACSRIEKHGYRRIGLILRDRQDSHFEFGRVVIGATEAYARLNQSAAIASPLILPELDAIEVAQWARREEVDAILLAGGGFTKRRGPQFFSSQLAQLGVHIGQDTGFAILCQPNHSGYAGIDERMTAIGQNAAKLLINQINRNQRGVPADPMTHLLNGSWHDGPSLPQVRIPQSA